MKGKMDSLEALLTIKRSYLALVCIYAIEGEIAFICSHFNRELLFIGFQWLRACLRVRFFKKKIFKIVNIKRIYFLKLCFDNLKNLRQIKKS
jgi:predicted neutral ceramidase superfamily lipid hydrolase